MSSLLFDAYCHYSSISLIIMPLTDIDKHKLALFKQYPQGITIEDLCEFRSHLSTSDFADTRDWCACLFAF
jgi:hypothetical protein